MTTKSTKSYCVYSVVAHQALAAMQRDEPSVHISVDLNLTRSTFPLCDDTLILDTHNRLSRAQLQQIAGKANRIFFLEDGEIEILENREDGYCKLVPTDQAPLLEIDGVKMHIAKGINPFESAGQMAAQVVRKGGRILDTCSGLGYSASSALNLGAREVISVELNAAVMSLRIKNPWSRRIFGAGIHLVHANIAEYIRDLATESFDAVIHDPPRISLAGQLYGESFYREIHRVLKRRGLLFHYTGNPHRVQHGSSFIDHAAQRLMGAGFTNVKKVVNLMGISACKK